MPYLFFFAQVPFLKMNMLVEIRVKKRKKVKCNLLQKYITTSYKYCNKTMEHKHMWKGLNDVYRYTLFQSFYQ